MSEPDGGTPAETITAVTDMIEDRYDGTICQRDYDVITAAAPVIAAGAAAAQRERLLGELGSRQAILAYVSTSRHVAAVLWRDVEDVLAAAPEETPMSDVPDGGTPAEAIEPREGDYGHLAYDAYAEYVGGKSVRGELLPAFHDQQPRIQNAWRVAASAAIGAAKSEVAAGAAAAQREADIKLARDHNALYTRSRGTGIPGVREPFADLLAAAPDTTTTGKETR